MLLVASLLLGITGLCIGSFLTVLIIRIPQKESLLGRSHCRHCKKTIAWYDLFPLVSYFSLRGRCRTCDKKITSRYPIIEFLNAIIWISAGYSLIQRGFFDLTFLTFITIGFHCFSWSILLAAAWIDGDHYYLPDSLIIPLLLFCSAFSLLRLDQSFFNQWFGALEGFSLFFLIFAVTKGKGFGFGDVKLAVILGLLLGSQFILLGLFLGVLLASLYAIIRMLQGQKTMKDVIPFAPFLVSGTFLVFLFQGMLSTWLSPLF